MISEMPKDIEPIKSFREVRSQSQTSTNNRRSLSSGLRSLKEFYSCFVFFLKISGNCDKAYMVSVSFHSGLRLALMVLVFLLTPSPTSGNSLTLTYGSLNPLGSMGIKFRAEITVK